MFVPSYIHMTQGFNIVICSNGDPSFKKIVSFLEEKGYPLFLANNEQELFKILGEHSIQLILLELDFNSKDGVSLTSDIRNIKTFEQPSIIIISSKQDDYIQITAFNAGVDDFIVTPVKPILLEAKIATYKKRFFNKHSEETEEDIPHKFFVDKDQYLIITENGKITLPRKEFEMIYLMYQNAHKIFTRQDFAKLVWNAPEVANSRTIDIHIRNIRRTLGNNIIKTAKGIGYMINPEMIA